MSVVGIDLGTTNTVVGCVRSGKVHVLADEKGVRLLPSVVSFHPNGEVLVGGAAKHRRIIDARNTVYSHKRLIGRSWNSPEIALAKTRFAFELKEGPGQGPLIHARGQDYTLPEVSAFVLKRARQIAELALGTPVDRAVITVPAHFNELQRASTKVAGRVSGLEVLRILNEPTAAALAYGLGRTGNERVAVYDFGGGTFDCTLLDLNGNVFEVLATAGDSFLGGDDIDQLIADRMAETFLKQHRQDVRQDPQLYERLKTTAEDIKIALSTAESHSVVMKELGHGAGGAALNFQFTLSRRDLDAMITPLVDRSFKVTQDALALARLSPGSFDKVILVGGSTRLPLVRKRVEAFFGAPPMDRVNPDEVVAIGAAIQAAALTEGIRRRSIPAPPGVPRMPSEVDTQENTQTSELDPAMLKPAFASQPPGFGFASQQGSQPPDKFAFASSVGSTPPDPHKAAFASTMGSTPPMPTQPPFGVPGARHMPSNRVGKSTNPGVAPATQPLPGFRAPAETGGPTRTLQAHVPETGFPDLNAPAPFEWFPTSGMPSSGVGTEARSPSERTFGGDPHTMTAALPPEALQAALGAQAGATVPAAGFGAIDDTPSLFSTPSGSLPSFPSLGLDPAIPSPLGEDPAPPWREQTRPPQVPDGAFGALPDLSLVSTTGVAPTMGVLPSSGPGFGHVADLSLISNTTATAAMDAIKNARQRAVETGQFDDETEAVRRLPAGGTLALEAKANPAAAKSEGKEEHDSLIDRADLPAVVARAKPARKPVPVAPPSGAGQLGMNPRGDGNSMTGKAPPLLAPQPFGPMERIPDDAPPSQRTVALQAPNRAPVIAKTKASPQMAMPAPTPQHRPSQAPGPAAPVAQAQKPFAQTTPLRQTPSESPLMARKPSTAAMPAAPPFSPGPPGPPPPQATPFKPAVTDSYPAVQPAQAQFTPRAPSVAHPPPQQTPSFAPRAPSAAPPPPAGLHAPSGPPPGFSGAPPPQQGYPQPGPFSFGSAPPGAFGSAPPAGQYGSAPPPPPPAYGSAPQAYGVPPTAQRSNSQPPIFGSFSSAPPAPAPGGEMPLDTSAYTNLPPQSAIPQIQFRAPILVDVTPRGLVVETAGGYTDVIIPRNSKIPCERTRRFATGRDMQTTVRVRVAQGESTAFGQNTFLGEVELSGLRPASRGEVTVAVTFEVDADGTLRIRARDVQTGQEARATLQLVGVADESSVVMMINRFANQPVVGGPTH